MAGTELTLWVSVHMRLDLKAGGLGVRHSILDVGIPSSILTANCLPHSFGFLLIYFRIWYWNKTAFYFLQDCVSLILFFPYLLDIINQWKDFIPIAVSLVFFIHSFSLHTFFQLLQWRIDFIFLYFISSLISVVKLLLFFCPWIVSLWLWCALFSVTFFPNLYFWLVFSFY